MRVIITLFLLLFSEAAVCAQNTQIARAVVQLRPGAVWRLGSDNCADLEWLDAVQVKPTCAEINTAISGFAATDAAEASRQAGLKADVQRAAMLTRLKGSTAAQIDNYVANNITNLAQAQAAIGLILKVIALDPRQ